MIPPQTPSRDMMLEDIEERIREVVRARSHIILGAFLEADYAKINVIPKEDFKEIINQHFLRLTDEQVGY